MTTEAASASTRKAGWKSWLPKVLLSVIGLAVAYFIFAYMASNFSGFAEGVSAAFSMPTVWTVAASSAKWAGSNRFTIQRKG